MHTSKLLVTLRSNDDTSDVLGTEKYSDSNIHKSRHQHRASITPHILLAHQGSTVHRVPAWMHPWDEYWWGLRAIKSTRNARKFLTSIKIPYGINSYLRYRYLMTELEYYGRKNEAVLEGIASHAKGFTNEPFISKVSNINPKRSSSTATGARHLGREKKLYQRRDKCLSFSDFANNHAVAHPPPSSLSASYFNNCLPVHAADLVATRLRKGVDSVKSVSHHQSQSKNQIWSLSIVDMRLLWTLGLRNSLFGYIDHYYEILDYQKNVSSYANKYNDEYEEKKKGEGRGDVRPGVQIADPNDSFADGIVDLNLSPSAMDADNLPISGMVDGAVQVLQQPLFVDPANSGTKRANGNRESVLSDLFLSPGVSVEQMDSRRKRLRRSNANMVGGASFSPQKADSLSRSDAESPVDFDGSSIASLSKHYSPTASTSLKARRMSVLCRDIQRHSFGSARSDVSGNSRGINRLGSDPDDGPGDGHSLVTTSRHSPAPVLKLFNGGNSNDGGIIEEMFTVSAMQRRDTSQKSNVDFISDDVGADVVLSYKSGQVSPTKESGHDSTESPPPSTVSTRAYSIKADDLRNRASSVERLFNQSESFGTHLLYDKDVLEDPLSGNSRVPSSAALNSVVPSEMVDDNEIVYDKKPVHQTHKPYFVVELIDPQVNFLDEKTQSSLLIVAGKSSLRGQKGTEAYLTKFESGDEPKRENSLRLLMDAVSAYTVSSSLMAADCDCSRDDMFFSGAQAVDNVVHWKSMDFTEVRQKGTVTEESLHKDPVRKVHFSNYSNEKNRMRSEDSQKSYSRAQRYDVEGIAMGRGNKKKNVKHLLLAIKDFEIRADYKFHEAIDNSEKKEFVIHKSDKELINLFVLDLPDVCVDITSSQFYIILHVVTNLLLAPPPKTESSWQKEETEDNVETKNLRVLSVAAVDPAPGTVEELSNIPPENIPIASTSRLLSSESLLDPVYGRIELDINDRKDRSDIQRVIDSMPANTVGHNASIEYGVSRHVEYVLGRFTTMKSNIIFANPLLKS